MKRLRVLVFILCACFVSVAWGQQPAATWSNDRMTRLSLDRLERSDRTSRFETSSF
jgi:hypothetical protein